MRILARAVTAFGAIRCSLTFRERPPGPSRTSRSDMADGAGRKPTGRPSTHALGIHVLTVTETGSPLRTVAAAAIRTHDFASAGSAAATAARDAHTRAIDRRAVTLLGTPHGSPKFQLVE